jgi:mono/diheme cytochrome c family protein
VCNFLGELLRDSSKNPAICKFGDYDSGYLIVAARRAKVSRIGLGNGAWPPRTAWKIRMHKAMGLTVETPRTIARTLRATARIAQAAAMLALAAIALVPAPALAFPWSIDMFRGPAVQPLEVAPRAMPPGTLPVDGTHYNTHYGQPAGMPSEPAVPPMKLELMTVRLQNPLQPTPEVLAHGRELFVTDCSPCHGLKGRGDGTVVHLLQHKPANLMTGVSKNLPDGYIYGYIRNGGIWMPSYDDAMSSTERWEVVVYLRSLEKIYGETEAKGPSAAAPSAPSAGTPQP